MYKIKNISNPKIKDPILIEGLPGMGNVGKVAVDFIIEKSKAKKIIEISSYNFPHAVFINENNLVELPQIEIYHKKIRNKDILLLAGDVQPLDESACYEFCDTILDIFEDYKGKEIITLGGIGLPEIPQTPQVYYTGNTKKIVSKYKSFGLNNQIYGVVGPIIGVSGLLMGLAKQRRIPAISLLAETFSHPAHLGIKGSREILNILNKKLDLNLDINHLDREINKMENELRTKRIFKRKKHTPSVLKKQNNELDYIG